MHWLVPSAGMDSLHLAAVAVLQKCCDIVFLDDRARRWCSNMLDFCSDPAMQLLFVT